MRALPPAAVVLLVLALPGCGGDGGRLSVEDFRAAANEICADAERRLAELGAPEDSAEGVASYADRAVPILADRQERLGRLEPPDQAAETFGEMLEQSAAELAALRSLRAAALDEDQDAAAEAFRRGRTATVAVNVLAGRLELGECVRRPATGVG